LQGFLICVKVHLGGDNIDLLSKKISYELSYDLRDIEKGDAIPLVSDTMFYTMFNNSKRKKYVAYFLSLILEEDYNEILENIEFEKENLDKLNISDSKKTVDLICKVKDKYYNIEMNNNSTDKEKMERNISYLGKIYSSSMKKGIKKYHYNNVLQININNFNFEGNEKAIDKFYIQNDDIQKLTDKITLIYIYLPLIRKKYYNKRELTRFEKFMIVLNEKKSEDLDNLIKEDSVMEEYRRDAIDASNDYGIVGLYDKEQEQEMLFNATLDRKYQEGIQKGIQEGEQNGIQKEKLNIVKRLMEMNMKIEDISKITDLSVKEIKELQ